MRVSWQEILPWVTSANTLWAVWLNGHDVRLSWKVSLANQALWLVFIVSFGTWGLLPLTLSLAAVFARHLTRPTKCGQDRSGVSASGFEAGHEVFSWDVGTDRVRWSA